jgi:hypothetical protein
MKNLLFLFFCFTNLQVFNLQSNPLPLTREEKVIAITILAEARGEGTEGMAAVAAVIAQRSIERKQTFQKVCLAKYQFSCWNEKYRRFKPSSFYPSSQGSKTFCAKYKENR